MENLNGYEPSSIPACGGMPKDNDYRENNVPLLGANDGNLQPSFDAIAGSIAFVNHGPILPKGVIPGFDIHGLEYGVYFSGARYENLF